MQESICFSTFYINTLSLLYCFKLQEGGKPPKSASEYRIKLCETVTMFAQFLIVKPRVTVNYITSYLVYVEIHETMIAQPHGCGQPCVPVFNFLIWLQIEF